MLPHLPSIEATILCHNFCWKGHAYYVDPSRFLRIMLHREHAIGTRPRRSPKFHFKDQLKQTLPQTNIQLFPWEETAMNKTAWSTAIHSGGRSLEHNCQQNKEQHPQLAPTTMCRFWPQCFHHRLGLQSYVWHKHQPRKHDRS